MFNRLDDYEASPLISDYVHGKDLDTSFKYILNDQGIETMEKGIKSLKDAAELVMAFNFRIESITLIDNTKN